MAAIECIGEAEFQFLKAVRFAGGDRFSWMVAGNHSGPLMVGGQEVAGVDLRATVRQMRCDHDERRQILVKRTQPVAEPRPHARPRECRRTGMHADSRFGVVEVRGLHRSDDADVVHCRAGAGTDH